MNNIKIPAQSTVNLVMDRKEDDNYLCMKVLCNSCNKHVTINIPLKELKNHDIDPKCPNCCCKIGLTIKQAKELTKEEFEKSHKLYKRSVMFLRLTWFGLGVLIASYFIPEPLSTIVVVTVTICQLMIWLTIRNIRNIR